MPCSSTPPSHTRSPSWRTMVSLLAVAAVIGVPAIAVVFSVSDIILGNGSPHGLAGARGVAVSPNGSNVYVAAETDGKASIYTRTGPGLSLLANYGLKGSPRDLDVINGALWTYDSTRVGFIQLTGSGDLNVDPAHFKLLFLPDSAEQRLVARIGGPLIDGTDERYLAYVTSSQTVRAIRATVSANDTVSLIEIWDTETPFGTTPWGLAISPNAQNLYVAVPSDDSLFAYDLAVDGSINGAATEYTEGDVEARGLLFIDGLQSVRSVAVSPDGEFVYTGSTFDGIAIFNRNTGSGALTFVAQLAVPGADLQDLAASPDGQYLAAADAAAGRVFLFSRNAGTGLLTLEDTISNTDIGGGLDGVEGVAFSPDSQFVLAASASGTGALVSIALSLFEDGFESGNTSAWN